MGTLDIIVIPLLGALLLGAGFYLVDQKKRAEALAVFGVCFLVCYVILQKAAAVDQANYLHDLVEPSETPHTRALSLMSPIFFDFFGLVGIVLIVAAAIVFVVNYHGRSIEEAELSSQQAEREQELMERGWLGTNAQKVGDNMPTYVERTSETLSDQDKPVLQ